MQMCSHAYFTVLQTIFFSVCVSFNLPGSYLDQFGPDVLQIHYSVIHHSQLLSACSALIHFTVGLQFLESTLKELSASSGFVLATMYAMWSEVCGQTCLEQFFCVFGDGRFTLCVSTTPPTAGVSYANTVAEVLAVLVHNILIYTVQRR